MQLSSKIYEIDDFAAAQELFHANGWTDGLPVVPPTTDAVAACLEWAVLPAETQRALLGRAGGNPLYAEEFVRLLADSDLLSGSLEDLPFPDSVQALIAARIDRLAPDAKALLQRAAVIGRIFWRGALERLSPEDSDLDRLLDDLRLREFVLDEQRSSIRGETAYKFKRNFINAEMLNIMEDLLKEKKSATP